MAELRYTVGWYRIPRAELSTFPPDAQEELRDDVDFWNSNRNPHFYATPGEAQWFLDQITMNNSDSNLRLLTPEGAADLFIVEGIPNPEGSLYPYTYRKYVTVGHIIPVPPA